MYVIIHIKKKFANMIYVFQYTNLYFIRKKNDNFFLSGISKFIWIHSHLAHGQAFRVRVNFIQAILKQETLLYQNIFVSFDHILYL